MKETDKDWERERKRENVSEAREDDGGEGEIGSKGCSETRGLTLTHRLLFFSDNYVSRFPNRV